VRRDRRLLAGPFSFHRGTPCHPVPSEPWCLGVLVVRFPSPVRHFCLLHSDFCLLTSSGRTSLHRSRPLHLLKQLHHRFLHPAERRGRSELGLWPKS
jgi:hypothetical protein